MAHHLAVEVGVEGVELQTGEGEEEEGEGELHPLAEEEVAEVVEGLDLMGPQSVVQ